MFVWLENVSFWESEGWKTNQDIDICINDLILWKHCYSVVKMENTICYKFWIITNGTLLFEKASEKCTKRIV